MEHTLAIAIISTNQAHQSSFDKQKAQELIKQNAGLYGDELVELLKRAYSQTLEEAAARPCLMLNVPEYASLIPLMLGSDRRREVLSWATEAVNKYMNQATSFEG